jgi:diaminopimelate decarboxylase
VTVERLIDIFGRDRGELLVGQVPLVRLTEQLGSTPYFAYDRERLTANVERVRSALPATIALSYAVKANPMPAVVQHLSTIVDGFDVASAGELRTALDTVMPAANVHFAGPGKRDAELRQAVAAGVTVELESLGEARRLAAVGDALGIEPRAAIRVNPDFAVKGSGMRMGGGPQQFGVDAERVPDLVAVLASTGIDMLGFHVFAGSQNLHAEVIAEAQRKTVELVVQLATSARQPIRYVNLGGGFGIPYHDRDEPLELSLIGDNLAELVDRHLGVHLPEARVVIELGRYLVGDAGVYVTRVVDRKESRGRTYLVVDGGLHHQLAASGNFGQVIRRNFPITVGNRLDEAAEPATVVGCLCTPLDLLGDDVALPAAEVGDLVVLFNAGAYGLTASPTAFLGHPAPPEALVGP